jgi:hypothetical protein
MPPVVPVPTVPINFVHAKAGEIIKLGSVLLRVMEDGTRTGTIHSLLFYPSLPRPFGVAAKGSLDQFE